MAKRVARHYDSHNLGGEVNVQVNIEDGKVVPKISETKPLHDLTSSDQTDRVQFTQDKFLWSRLPPYPGWEHSKIARYEILKIR